MDKKPASDHRWHFKTIIPSAYPVLIYPEVVREAILLVNEGTQALRVGHSGTVSSIGTYIAGGATLADNYSVDEYWAIATATSGTLSGFVVL